MKKRLLSLTLIAALCLSLLPVTALAAGEDAPDTLLVDGIDVTNGGYWTTNNGSLTQTQSTTEWNVHYDTSTNILNLNNATIKNDASDQNSNGAAIYAAGDAGQDVTLTIKVEGSNVISGAHGIYMLGESSSEENPSLSLSIEKAANATNASPEITGTDNGITLSNDGSKSLSISNVDVTASGGENGAGVYMSGSGGGQLQPQRQRLYPDHQWRHRDRLCRCAGQFNVIDDSDPSESCHRRCKTGWAQGEYRVLRDCP